MRGAATSGVRGDDGRQRATGRSTGPAGTDHVRRDRGTYTFTATYHGGLAPDRMVIFRSGVASGSVPARRVPPPGCGAS